MTDSTFIDSVDTDVLFAEKTNLSKIGFNLSGAKSYRFIFCPINIRNRHWTLFVIEPQRGTCFFLDPLESKSFHIETIAKAEHIRQCLMQDSSLCILSEITEYPIPYCKQTNSHDCGPFICAFAEKLALGESLIDIDANRIRFLTYCHLPATTLAPILEGGGDLVIIPTNNFPPHLLHFDDSHISAFSFTFAETKAITITHPILSKAICTHNAEFLVNNARLPEFHQKSKILLPLLFKNSTWILIVANMDNNSICVMDPTHKVDNEQINPLIRQAAVTITQLALHDKPLISSRPSFFQTSPIASNSGPLVCGYLQAISHNSSPTEINIDKIRRTCNAMKKRYTRSYQINGPSITSAIPTGASLQTRKELANSISSRIHEMNITEALEMISQHTYLLRSKTTKKNYMGLHQETHLTVTELRKLYKINSKRAFNLITQHISADCYPTEEDIFNYYSSKSTELPLHPNVGGLPIKQGPSLSFGQITKEQLMNTFKKLNKSSAPGKSNITYTDMIYCDPDLTMHLTLFNKILESGDIPDAWRKFETMLIPKPMKQGHYNNVSSWRPIALLDCQYKLFTAVLASVIHQWCLQNQLLHPLQKSLGPSDGCTEHNFLIRAIIDRYENQLNLPIHALFLDIADAFGSISIDVILNLIYRMGLSVQSCNLIKQIYMECSHQVKCGSMKTKNISVKVGVRQGCPLSMILFNIGINPLLFLVDKILAGGTLIGSHRICGLAFADDLVLLATSKPAAQDLANAAQNIANILGLTFRSSKCSLLSIPQTNDKPIIIDNKKIAIIKPGEIQVYLGTDLGHKVSSTPEALFHRLIDEYRAIANSALTPWQKLHAKTVHIHSALIFAFRNFLIPITEIYGNKNRNTIERRIRALDKKVLGLNSGASNSYLYAPRNLGGVGLTSIVDEYLAQSLAHAIQILNCRNRETRDAAFMFLRRCATGKFNLDLVSTEEALEWLNTGIANDSAHCWWTRVKYAIEKMRKLHQTDIVFRQLIHDGEVTLEIKQELSTNNKTSFEISFLNLKEASKCLHTIFSKSWYWKWMKQPSAGRFVTAIGESTYNKSIYYSGELSISEWHFVHQCNTITLPLLANPGRERKEKCRRCGIENEDLPHVLVKCKISEDFWHMRHNAIVYFLASQIRIHTDAEVTIDDICQFTGSKKRVDLVLKYERNSTILLVDVKCPYQTDKCIENADEANRFYYADLASNIRSVMPLWTVSVMTVAVGTPGTWPKLSTKTLHNIGFRSETIHTIARHCILSNIKWTNAQWRFHRDGIMPDVSHLTKNIDLIPALCEPDQQVQVDLLDELVVHEEVETRSEDEWADIADLFEE